MIQPTAQTTPRFDTGVVERERTPATYDTIDAVRATSWGAIIAGAVAALSLMAIFAVLGTAIGLSVISATNDTPEKGVSIGAGIYWLITGLVSLFVGGWIASCLRRSVNSGTGAMHGFLAWCTVTVISTVLLAVAGGAALGGSMAAVGDAMRARNLNITQSPDRDRINTGPNSVSEQDAKDAAKKAAGASWWTFVALVLGASVASVGGAAAARKYDYDHAHNNRRVRSTAGD